jgi:hypothetical protein
MLPPGAQPIGFVAVWLLRNEPDMFSPGRERRAGENVPLTTSSNVSGTVL